MKMKTVKVNTGVDRKVMSGIARFLTHSNKSLKISTGVGKKRRR